MANKYPSVLWQACDEVRSMTVDIQWSVSQGLVRRYAGTRVLEVLYSVL